MLTIENNLQTTVVGSEDGKYTYEVKRSWEEGRKALVIELYPTVSIKKSGYWDLSAMHLMNHASELGWGEVRIINLIFWMNQLLHWIRKGKKESWKL